MQAIWFRCPDDCVNPDVVEQICALLEAVVPGLSMGSSLGVAKPEKLSNRRQYIASQLAKYDRNSTEAWVLTVCSSDPEEQFISLSVRLPYVHLAEYAVGAYVSVSLPEDIFERALCAHLLGEIGDVCRAWHGTARLDVGCLSPEMLDSQAQSLLPHIIEVGKGKFRRRDDVPIHLVPSSLQWMHYLSADVATLAQFPVFPADEHLLFASAPTDAGSWILNLTRDRLNLAQQEDCDALRKAYARFDTIWVRQ